MTEIFPFVVLAIVLAIVARSLIGLTQFAARSGRLRPVTVKVLIFAPVVAFAIWVVWLVWRMAAQADGYSLWPFELAVAVVFWLTWVGIVALVVSVHEQLTRLFSRTKRPDDSPDP